ncbi:MAG: AMP-dependent synthetase/ligase, partial [Solirubrobacteraceae bacterium]
MEGAVQTRGSEAQRPRALNARTLCEAFQITAAEHSDRVALRTLGDGVSITFGEYAESVRSLAAGLHALGVGPRDTVGFMLVNRPEFHLLDTAAMHLGATPFSIYNTSSAEQIAYLLDDAANRVLVVEPAFLERARQAMSQAGAVEHLVVLDETPPDAISLERLKERGRAAEFNFETAWRAVEPDAVLTLIYTSGTTGPPKGVQLTHANELAQCRGLDRVFPWQEYGSVVSFLPMAHIADRGFSHYAQMVCGHAVTSCPDPAQVFAHIAEVRPTLFGSVPRIWEKLKAALEAGIAAEPDEARRRATLGAIELGLQKVRAEQAGETVPADLAERHGRAEEQVFSKIRARLGFERCEHYVIGAAPTPLEVLEFFAAIGIPICEVWGMSELSSVATCVPPGQIRLGTVGPPIAGVEVKLETDGEVLVRGATVMLGYRNQPERTAETIDGDGWLHSGDIGRFDEAGYLSIIDRKKELIIN